MNVSYVSLEDKIINREQFLESFDRFSVQEIFENYRKEQHKNHRQ